MTSKVDLVEQRAIWVRQWKSATTALAEQRASELRAMTTEQAWEAIESLLSLELDAPLPESRERCSGLVALERYLGRLVTS